MSLKGNKINHPASHKRPINRRRKSALALLEAQIMSGVKTVKGSTLQELLTDKDKVRINKEIITLKSKII